MFSFATPCYRHLKRNNMKTVEHKRLKRNEYARNYRKAHKEQLRAYGRKYMKTYYKKNKDKYKHHLELNKEWKKKNQKVFRIWYKKYYEKNKEEIIRKHIESAKKYRRTHAKEIAQRAHLRYLKAKAEKQRNK